MYYHFLSTPILCFLLSDSELFELTFLWQPLYTNFCSTHIITLFDLAQLDIYSNFHCGTLGVVQLDNYHIT